MNNGLALKGAAMIAAGALGLVGLGAVGPVFDPGTAAAEGAAPSWRQPVAAERAPSDDAGRAGADETGAGTLREGISGMLREHMGVTGEQAADWAVTMEGVMRSMHGDEAGAMLEYCAEAGVGSGMMGGGSGWSGGMMGGGSGRD